MDREITYMYVPALLPMRILPLLLDMQELTPKHDIANLVLKDIALMTTLIILSIWQTMRRVALFKGQLYAERAITISYLHFTKVA